MELLALLFQLLAALNDASATAGGLMGRASGVQLLRRIGRRGELALPEPLPLSKAAAAAAAVE